jgi:hypothetical protein
MVLITNDHNHDSSTWRIFGALSVSLSGVLALVLNKICGSLDVFNGGGCVVFIATNHFLFVALVLPYADGLCS